MTQDGIAFFGKERIKGKMNRHSKKMGVILVVLSSVLYGIMPMLIKAALADGMTINCSMVYRFFCMAIVSLLILKKRKVSLTVEKQNIRDLLIFGFFGFGFTNLFLGMAYLHIPLGLATVCHFIYPVVVVMITRIFFKEQLNMKKCLAALFTVAGLVILMRCNGDGGWKGMLFAGISGLTYGCYMISLDKSSLRKLNEMVIVFYVTTECGIFYLIFSILGGSFQGMSSGLQVIGNLGAAIVGMTATVLLAKGVRIIGASRTAFISMLEPLTSTLIDFLVYGIVPSFWHWIGTLSMLSAVGIIALDREKTYKESENELA